MTKKSQIDKFRETARALDTDESESKFDAALRKVATANPDPKAQDDLAEMIGQKDPHANFGKTPKPRKADR